MSSSTAARCPPFAWLAAAAASLLLLNYPTSVLFTRLYMGTVRRLGANIGNTVFALCGVLVWWAARRRSYRRNEEFRLELERFSSTPER